MIKKKNFIRTVLVVQLAILGLAGLTIYDFDIPFLRQVIGFVYLTFIPGLLILRILKLHKLGSTETLLYSVGLSIAFVMFTGLFMNTLYPIIGIPKPISVFPVIFTIAFMVLILCIIAHERQGREDESFSQPHSIRWSELCSPPALLLLLFPLIAILGTHLAYAHQNNILLLILLSLTASIVILITYDKFIPAKLYPVAIITIAIALLWHWSLVSPSLQGFDIHHEYWVQNRVISSSIWDHTYASNCNAMLSVVMLAPIYSLMLNLDAIWVIKIIYPLFFSLAPLALFQSYKRQTSDKIAFLAAFFFISFPVFFSELTGQIRQPIAELFLSLSILLFLEKEIYVSKRATMLIIFGVSTVISHYGLSYFYMFYLITTLLLLFLWKSSTVSELWQSMMPRFSKSRHRVGVAQQGSTLRVTYVMLIIVFCIAWYLYVSSGSAFNTVIRIGNHVYHTAFTELFSFEARDPHVLQALGLMPMRSVDVEWRIFRILQYITQFFIVVGAFWLIANPRKTRFHTEYVAMILMSIVLIAMCIVLPYFAAYLNMTRVYHITLFFLSPLCILGGITTFHWLSRIVSVFLLHREAIASTNTYLKLVVIIVLVPYFLFCTGFVYELTGATPSSMPLALYKADWSVFTGSEVSARNWIKNFSHNDYKVYADNYGVTQLNQEMQGRTLLFPADAEQLQGESYIFLRWWNIVHGEVLSIGIRGVHSTFGHIYLKDFSWFAQREINKIYDSGNAQIFWPLQEE